MTFIVAACLCPVAAQSQNSKYRSEADGFAISFPGQVSKKNLRTKDGVAMTSFQSMPQDKSWGAQLASLYVDPRETRDLRVFLADVIDGIVGRGFKVSDQIMTTYQGRPTMQFSIAGDGVSGSGRILVDKDLVLIMVGIALDEKDHSMIEPFLQSLEVLDR